MEGEDEGTGAPLFSRLLIQMCAIYLLPAHAHQDFMSWH